MPPKQRQMRIQQTNSMASMQQLESRTDEELLREQKYKAAANAILGTRAAERYDAAASREYFRKALAAARPQERMAIRRMADASLALAERRPDDLKASLERLGQTPPSNRQLFMLRAMGFLAPPAGSSTWLRARGFLLVLGLVVALLAIGTGIVQLVGLPFGGVSIVTSVWVGILLLIVVLGLLALLGRRRQQRAKAARAAGPPPGRK
jgi:hypothetical protein